MGYNTNAALLETVSISPRQRSRSPRLSYINRLLRAMYISGTARDRSHRLHRANMCANGGGLTFDVAPIVVLIGHDHQVPVPQALRVLVVMVELQPQDLHHVLLAHAKKKENININRWQHPNEKNDRNIHATYDTAKHFQKPFKTGYLP